MSEQRAETQVTSHKLHTYCIYSMNNKATMKLSILSLCIAAGSVLGDSPITSSVGRLLQDAENVTATAVDIDDAAVEPEPEVTAPAPADDVAVTPWRHKPGPLPDNYKLTTSFDSSDEDYIYAYTWQVAGQDVSITSHTDSEYPDEEDPVLYFKLSTQRTSPYCEPSDAVPTSFMTSKFEVFDSDSPTLTRTEKMCWKAPAGYFIPSRPSVHKLIFQMFHHTLRNPGTDWKYDDTISTNKGKGKSLVERMFTLMFIDDRHIT